MKRFFSHASIGLSGVLALTLLLDPGQAEVFERDWKEPGDGLLTYDDINNREWLDLSQTLLEQFAEPGADFPEDHYANVVAELGPGGLFEGFSVAKREDVTALAESAGIDPSTGDFELNSVPMAELMELIDVTVQFPTQFQRSQGYLDEFSDRSAPECPCRFASVFQLNPPITPSDSGRATLLFGDGDDNFEPAIMGVMLYRTAIPEPSSLMLGLVCIGAIAVAASHSVAISSHDYSTGRYGTRVIEHVTRIVSISGLRKEVLSHVPQPHPRESA